VRSSPFVRGGPRGISRRRHAHDREVPLSSLLKGAFMCSRRRARTPVDRASLARDEPQHQRSHCVSLVCATGCAGCAAVKVSVPGDATIPATTIPPTNTATNGCFTVSLLSRLRARRRGMRCWQASQAAGRKAAQRKSARAPRSRGGGSRPGSAAECVAARWQDSKLGYAWTSRAPSIAGGTAAPQARQCRERRPCAHRPKEPSAA